MTRCGVPIPAQISAGCATQGAQRCALRVEATQTVRLAYWLDANAEFAATKGATSEETKRAQRHYCDTPLIALTGANTISGLPIPRTQAVSAARLWQSGHDRLASFSSVGATFTVAGSGDNIELDRPTAVISAVDEVVVQSRARKSTKP